MFLRSGIPVLWIVAACSNGEPDSDPGPDEGGSEPARVRLDSPIEVEGAPVSGFGTDLALVGDVDGDGTPDVLVGAPNEGAVSDFFGRDGRAHLFSGADGRVLLTMAAPEPTPNNDFGRMVAVGPDLDGDGALDLLVGAPGQDTERGRGALFLFSSRTGELLRTYLRPIDDQGFFDGSVFGLAAAIVRDFDGDGVEDVLTSQSSDPASLARTGVELAYVLSSDTGAPLLLLEPPDPVARAFGFALGVGPDVNGDGDPEFIVGEPDAGVEGGALHVFSGEFDPDRAQSELLFTLRAPERPEEAGGFGSSFSVLDDLDGDGIPDLATIAPNVRGPGGEPRARAYLLSGRDGRVIRGFDTPSDRALAAFRAFPARVSVGPDIDGDGRRDVVVGLPEGGTDPTAEPPQARIHSAQAGQVLDVLEYPHVENNGLSTFDQGTSLAFAPDWGEGSALLVGAPPGAVTVYLFR